MKSFKMARLLCLLMLIFGLVLMTACGTSDGGTGGDNTDTGNQGTTDGGSGGSSGGGSQGGGSGSGETDDGGTAVKKVKVTVISGEGIVPLENNPIVVDSGSDVSFNVELKYGYLISEVEGADYDVAKRIVTLKNVTRDTRIRLAAESVGYNTTGTYKFYLEGNVVDKANYFYGSQLYTGTPVTVKANYDGATFVGWSLGKTVKDGGEIISKSREYTFIIGPTMGTDGVCRVYANYSATQENAVYYHLNGGSVNTGSVNMTNKTYYTATVEGTAVKVTLGNEYFDLIGAVACLFWDDGTFYRDGYVLKEFNTMPDGSGVGYSSGYKYPIKTEGSDLYCIWAKVSDVEDFYYENVKYPLPSGSSKSKAHNWQTEGIIITGYKGGDTEVVIPEKIGDKYVTGIAKGAFTDKKNMTSLVLNKFLIEIQDGAFVNCTNLETVYYPDGVYYVSNDSFDAATWGNVKNFYVYASMAPRLSEGWNYAIKFTRFIANPDKKRVALLAGSSGLYGHTAGYLEALLGADEWCSINFGMVMSFDTHLIIPLLGQYCKEGDIILFAPENSLRNMGYPDVYWKSLTYLEHMLNFYRAVDISYYSNILSTYAEINQGSANTTSRYAKTANSYEYILNAVKNYSEWSENDSAARYEFNDPVAHPIKGAVRYDCMYKYAYTYSDLDGKIVDIRETGCVRTLNYDISVAQAHGAKVYYNFAPVSDTAILADARAAGPQWFDDFETFIMDTFAFDGVLGDAENYIFNVKYFYDSQYHPNNYGKTYRTYRVYLDLCELLGIEQINDFYLGGTPDADGFIRDEEGNSLYHATLFEAGSEGGQPVTPAKIFPEEE